VNGEWSIVNKDLFCLSDLTIKLIAVFLTLNHQRLDIYKMSRQFVLECYKLTNQLPNEEKFGIISQIRRAALSVHLNIASGASGTSEIERKRYFEIARGPVIEVDAALDIALDFEYLNSINILKPGESMISCFKMLTGLINSKIKE
jgi:four helix bundle protein